MKKYITARSTALKLNAQGVRHKEIAEKLNTMGLKTKDGKEYTAQMIWRVLKGPYSPTKSVRITSQDGTKTFEGPSIRRVLEVANECDELDPKTKKNVISILLANQN